MISTESAISQFRRSKALGSIVRGLLIAGTGVCLLLGPILGARLDTGAILFVIGMVWLVLSFRSAQGSRMTQLFSGLIAAGQWEQAEVQIEQSLKAFSLFRSTKLMSLHQLALLRHAQNRYPDAAVLCRALLGQRLGSLAGLNKSSRLILADALLEMGEVRGAYEAIIALHDQRLSLGEAVRLLVIELDYGSRVGAWDSMMSNIMTKVQLSELMPSHHAAQSQALLALAAKKVGRADLADWLRRRAELLAEPSAIIAHRPILKEVFE